jgi:hypothetical protein
MPVMLQRILFRLTPSHLLVANTGKPFSKEGFEAVCYTDTSSKIGEKAAQAASEAEAKSWVDDLIENKRKTFSDPKQLQSASGTEQRTANDYSARLLLELLQNALDADRQVQIGYKGIGFRSVLNVGEVIEIHSGHLHVRWSEADARESLKEMGELPERLPILDLPAWNDPDDEARALLKARGTGGYETVVKLKINGEGLKHVGKEWDKFASDPSMLLFIDGKIEIRWEREETRCTWRRNQDGKIVTVSVEETAQSSKELRWHSFESGHARAAFALNDSGVFQPSGVSEPRLRSYFPANLSPHPFTNLFLHHGKFELQSNRENINPNDMHLGELAQAMLEAAQSVENQSELLDLLQVGSLDEKDESRIDSKVWKAAQRVLNNAPLRALGGRKLADIKTCPKWDSPPSGWGGDNRQKNWAAFLAALKQVRQEALNGLPVLEPYIENTQREVTLLKFNPACAFTPLQLQKQSWAPVEASPESVSSSAFKVFLPYKGVQLNPPQGIQVRFLNKDFQKAFETAGGGNLDSFLTQTLNVLTFSALSVVEHSVLPTLSPDRPAEPDDEMIRFLKCLRDVDSNESKKAVESFDWYDKVRRELIQKLHLQCQGRSWSILQIYAGQNWTANSFLEATYGDQRGYLDSDPPADEEQKKSWEDFWRWLGVGWCPKVLPVLEAIVVEKPHGEGLAWEKENGRFQGRMQSEPEEWSEYCRTLHDDVRFKSWDYFPRLKANWTIDGGTSVLARTGAFEVIGRYWQTYKGWLHAKIGYSTNGKINHDNQQNGELPSHLAWLFQTAKWVPCASALHCGCNVFQPSGTVAKELKAFVPRLDLPENEVESNQMPLASEFLNACGIRNGWKEVNDSDWRLWLTMASQMEPNDNSDNQKSDAIRGLYRALLDHRKRKTGGKSNEKDAEPLVSIALWSIERSNDAHENWHLLTPNHSKPFFVDRPDVADVNLPGLRVFPVRLDGLAGKARQHLDLRPLSEALSGEPTEEGSVKLEFSSVIRDRLHELMAYLQLDGIQKNDSELQLALESVTLRESTGLKVQFLVDCERIGEPLLRSIFQRFDKETRGWAVFVDSDCPEDKRWEAFAEALLLSSGQDTNKALNVRELLRCKAEDLPERMIKLRVAPETAEALRNKRDERVEQPPSLPAPQSAEEATTTAANQVPEQAPAVPANRPPSENGPTLTKGTPGSEHPAGSSSERRPRLPTDGRRSPSSRPHPEEGMSAQRWLFESVMKWCGKQQQPEPIWELDHVDITIPLSPPFLIEAKRIDGSTIHWSRNQIEKAKANPGRYVVALLRPKEGDEKYEVFWAREPLQGFLRLQRQVEWTWQVQKKGGFSENSWDEPEEKPSKPADSFNAEVIIDEMWLQALPRGVDALESIVTA